jgi:hypothetical protein
VARSGFLSIPTGANGELEVSKRLAFFFDCFIFKQLDQPGKWIMGKEPEEWFKQAQYERSIISFF